MRKIVLHVNLRANSYVTFFIINSTEGACGYDDPIKQSYGLTTAALSTALFNDGYICGACYEIMCANDPQRCLPGSIKITATNLCPPDYSKTKNTLNSPYQCSSRSPRAKEGLCRLSIDMFVARKPVVSSLKLETTLIYLDIKAMQIKGSRTRWITMTQKWGQNWGRPEVELFGQGLSFRITTSNGITKDFINVAPPNWTYGQTFDGKINF